MAIPVKRHFRRKPKRQQQPFQPPPQVLNTQDAAKVMIVTPAPPQEVPKPTMKEKIKKTFALPKRKRKPATEIDEFAETAENIAETVEKVKK